VSAEEKKTIPSEAASSLRPFFHPAAVAVVGASRDPMRIGSRLLDEMIRAEFRGKIYPVNPNATEIQGLKVFPSIRAIPNTVDLAVIAVPRDAVMGVVDDCATRGVRAIVVITAGFAETNAEGKQFQLELLEKVRGYGMRMIGPNCMGLLNTDPSVRLNASFSPVFPPSGPLAMSSQSGALGLAILALAAQRNLGLSTFVSVGNKADVSGNDLIEYWESDPATRVILLYLESFGNPRRFAQIARRVGRDKPIVAVKAGRSTAGKRAAGSHTAALAASDVAVDALFRQAGVIRAETLDELFDVAVALSSQPLIQGRRIGIVTNAGGPGILCADACAAAGLTVPELSEETRKLMRVFLPAAASISNPVDMVASAGPGSYTQTIATVLACNEIDALVVLYIPLERQASSAFATAIREGVERGRAEGGRAKPVLACVMSDQISQTLLESADEIIPAYRFPETPARVLGKCVTYSEWKSSPPGNLSTLANVGTQNARRVVQDFVERNGSGWLPATDVEAILEGFGIPMPGRGTARTGPDAVVLSERIGFPVALKLASTRILHKSDVGGVQLNLSDSAAVEDAFTRIQNELSSRGLLEAMDGVVVQKMVSGGVELMAGVATDPAFGPLIAFGLGGIHVEILGDVQFRIAPISDKDAREMVRSIRGFRLLEGYRGHPPADLSATEDILLRVSRMVELLPEISELDLNPLVALPPGQGCFVLDARIHIAAPGNQPHR
jgi:acetyl coenzyme A synthetase (ADP forming)-like protein